MLTAYSARTVESFAHSTEVTADDFKTAFRNHPAGVAVVTADAGNGPVGLTASSVFSVSAEPPLLVFSLSDHSSATPELVRADTVVVHLLGADQLDLAKLCSSRGVDRFADTSSWSRLETGEPRFHSADTWVRGRVLQRISAGGSTLVVVLAVETKSPDQGSIVADPARLRPLVYHNRTWHELNSNSKLG